MDGIVQTVKFMEEMMRDEPLISVIRGHLYIESRLESILLSKVPGAQGLLKQMGFARKTKAATAYGLIDKHATKSLFAINRIRNAFAHELTSKTLNASDDTTLASTLRGEMLRHYEYTIESIKRDGQTFYDGLRCKVAIGAIYFALSNIHLNLLLEETSRRKE